MAKLKTFWSCQECGHRQTKWSGNCTICQKWNTFVEEIEAAVTKSKFSTTPLEAAQPVQLKSIDPGQVRRLSTSMSEVDRLLGGGIVAGSLTLLGGDPGIGKSTLMLQISQGLASQGLTVLYVCGEESVEQTSLRAKRLGVEAELLYLLNETIFSHIKLHIDRLKPDVLIIDSIQILYKPELSSSPGSVSQVRDIAAECMILSKSSGISTFLIGHVTKTGEIAGPKVLEHIVDIVLDFEGDRHHGYRLLRALKNRFGPTDDVALFQMGIEGLNQVNNPSLLFLQERLRESVGSVIVPTVEGTRAMLIEVQGLVAASAFSTSTRKSTGLDQNRLALLLAVLEKRMGYSLHHCDVFVSVAGGIRITEPAIDLSILMAIASSFCNRPIDPDTVVIGEVGLGGEVRSVPRIESRLKEAAYLGFRRVILPKRNLQGLSIEFKSKIDIQGVELVEEAIRTLIG
ncbi:MAG: DNA repair protein RadA [Simkania sp.]|nr:DNA repair protein RadA [Simkania sp.]